MSPGPLTHAQAERFKRLVWPLMADVLRAAQVLTRSGSDADDLAQETMIKAMRAIDTYEDGTNTKAWLLTILRNAHIDRLRGERARPTAVSLEAAAYDPPDHAAHAHHEPGAFDEQWPDPHVLMNRFDDEAVIEALHELPEDIRWTLLLVDVEQLDHQEAAKLLNVAVGTVKSRTHRGRTMLRDRLYQLAVQRGWVSANE